jgi:hypothetical protein
MKIQTISLTIKVTNLVNEQDMKDIIKSQTEMKQRLAETNKAFLACNNTTEQRLPQLQKEYIQHAQMLSEMKTDLEYVTKKIRYLIFVVLTSS